MTDGRLQWHPGFSAALRVELEEELDELCIEDEHMLSKKPMQIDVLIVKKGRTADKKEYRTNFPQT